MRNASYVRTRNAVLDVHLRDLADCVCTRLARGIAIQECTSVYVYVHIMYTTLIVYVYAYYVLFVSICDWDYRLIYK